MEKTAKQIKLENNICDLAHEIVLIFFPETSEGSWKFQNKKERVINILKKNKDIFDFRAHTAITAVEGLGNKK